MADMVFSETLQKLRKGQGVTQEQLASYLGVSPQAVSKWENGGYPDGDLLPRLADYFGVSIDYLYGRETEKVSMEQALMDRMKEVYVSEKWEHPEYFEQMFRYLWAMQLGSWYGNRSYRERHPDENDQIIASMLLDSAGFSYIRLDKQLEFTMVMKEPEDGFASCFKGTDELAGLFGFLSGKANLRVLFYLLSLKGGESVRAAAVARCLELEEKKVEEALDYLSEISFYRGFLQKGELVEYNKNEYIYTINQAKAVAVLMLLAGADTVLHQPNSYSIQICNRENSLFKREQPEFLQSAPGDTDR